MLILQQHKKRTGSTSAVPRVFSKEARSKIKIILSQPEAACVSLKDKLFLPRYVILSAKLARTDSFEIVIVPKFVGGNFSCTALLGRLLEGHEARSAEENLAGSASATASAIPQFAAQTG